MEPRVTLADFLREQCRLTGTHLGCEHGVCGACTVLVDGAAVRSCLVFAVQADGAEVTTIEGIGSPDGELSTVQAAFRDCHGLQCGFCTPGLRRVGDRVPPRPPEPDRRGDPRGAVRQPLSLHRVPGHRRSGAPGRRASDRGEPVMTQTHRRGRGSVRRRARRARRGRPPAHRPRHVRRRRHAPGDAARVLRAQPVPPSCDPGDRHVGRAAPLPGVRFVFTAADLNPGVKEQWHTAIGQGPDTPRPPLAEGEVRFVGDPVALVVAESRYLAEDAAELVDVDYEPLPPVVDYTTAEHADALVHESHGSNVAGELAGLPASALEDVFASAAHVVSETISQQAYAPVPMEGRGLVVDYSRGDGRAHDPRGDAVTARGAPLLLPPARDARAPHPGRHARHRWRLRAEGHGPARRDVPDARGAEGRRAGEVGRGPPREPARRRPVAPRARQRCRWPSTPTARSWRRTSTSSPTAARIPRPGR